MKIPNPITAMWLRERGACAEQVAIFEEVFPAGARHTLAAARTAAKAHLSFDWLATQLPGPARDAYVKAKVPAILAALRWRRGAGSGL